MNVSNIEKNLYPLTTKNGQQDYNEENTGFFSIKKLFMGL